MLCIFGLSACGGTQQSTSQQGQQSSPGANTTNNANNQSSIQLTLAPNPTSTPVVAATSTASAQATATIANAGPAILGASLDAFIAKFGQPNTHSTDGEPHFNGCNNSTVDQLIVSQVSLESNAGPITAITAQACTPWTASFANTYCSSFLPSDAKYERSVNHPASSSQFASTDKIYYSAALAQEFAAEDFSDGSGDGVQPGLFDVNYLYASTPIRHRLAVASWSLVRSRRKHSIRGSSSGKAHMSS